MNAKMSTQLEKNSFKSMFHSTFTLLFNFLLQIVWVLKASHTCPCQGRHDIQHIDTERNTFSQIIWKCYD